MPAVEAQVGGSLHTLALDLTIVNTEVSRTTEGDNLIIDDENASAEQKMSPDETTILSILTVGGQIEDYLHGIRAPISIATEDVPEGVPIRTNKFGTVKKFVDWFLPGAEVWKKDDNSEVIFYNNPNPSAGTLLTASESELIRQIDTATYSFMTVEEVTAEVANGWTKF